jgi:hypothetical protein
MIVLCVSMRMRPTAATFLSLCGIFGTCGTMKLTRICDQSLQIKKFERRDRFEAQDMPYCG